MNEYDLQFDLQFPEPIARLTDPETSHMAAQDAKFSASKGRRAALLSLFHNGPQTDYELADATGKQQNSIGKRRGDCVAAHLVTQYEVDGVKVRRPAPSGSMAQVWSLTEKGFDYVKSILSEEQTHE